MQVWKFPEVIFVILLALLLALRAFGEEKEEKLPLTDAEIDQALLGDWDFLSPPIQEEMDPAREKADANSSSPSPALSSKEIEQLTEELLAELTLARWQHEVVGQAGLGYTDNALLTPVLENASAFAHLELEYLGFRLPDQQNREVFFYGFLEYRRFEDVPSVEDEIIGILQGSYKQPLGGNWTWETSALSLYNEQVFGISPTEDQVIAAPLTILQLSLIQKLRYAFSDSWSGNIAIQADRTIFRDSDDDYWDPHLEFSLLVEQSSWTWKSGIEFSNRIYDDRLQQQPDGTSIPGAGLETTDWEPFVRVAWENPETPSLEWGASLSYRQRSDNGPGYHDSKRSKATLWTARDFGPWSFRLEGEGLFYEYPNRTVSALDDSRFELTQVRASLDLVRDLPGSWKAYLDYRWEETQSRRELSSYSTHEVLLSLQYAF